MYSNSQICVLNIVLPEEVIPMELFLPAFVNPQANMNEELKESIHSLPDEAEIKWPDRLTDTR